MTKEIWIICTDPGTVFVVEQSLQHIFYVKKFGSIEEWSSYENSCKATPSLLIVSNMLSDNYPFNQICASKKKINYPYIALVTNGHMDNIRPLGDPNFKGYLKLPFKKEDVLVLTKLI